MDGPMGALEEEVARVCGLSLWQEGKLTVPTEAVLEKCCIPSGRSLPPAIGAGRTSRDITQLLSSKKKLFFYLCLGKKKKDQFFAPGDL